MKKKFITLILVISFLTLVPPLATVSAKKPLIGIMDLQFNLAWPGPQDEIPDWIGTITIDGEEYGMAFFAIGSGKPFETDPSTSVHFFEEIYEIYFDLTYAFDNDGNLIVFEPSEIALWGYDVGITNMVNSKYHMKGNVEDADGDFEKWIGRNVFMSGIIEWYPFGAPYLAPGTFRIN
jgi:hypothetical protein